MPHFTVRVLLETAVEIAIAAAVLWAVRRRVSTAFATIPWIYRASCPTILLLILAGHVAGRDELLYPWVSWNMFTASYAAEPTFIDYTVERAAGPEERLLVGPTVGLARLRTRLDERALEIDQSQDDDQRRRAVESLQALLQTVAEEFNQRHQDNPIRRVRVWRCTLPALDYRGPASIRRQLIGELTLR